MTDRASLDRLKAALADRYRLERELGSGGMATVYVAEDLKHHRNVAIKVLKPELAAVLGHERFLREIDLCAGLRHPHILPLYDSGDAEGVLYYVMPYAEGETLRERLNRETQLPLEDALQIALEVADALGYAHSHGVIHRDIKPENVLLESGHAVVADFGIARAVNAAGDDRLTQTGMVIGTPTYLSPEQAAGQSALDGRSDVYSLGCVLYEMLAGRPAFQGATIESLIHQHLMVEPPSVTALRPSVPEGIAATLGRALAKNPADRFHPAEFSQALRLSLTPGPGAAGGRRRIGTRRAVAMAAVGAALAAATALLVLRQYPSRTVTARGSEMPFLAVLPFENISADAGQEYFSAGMTEEIIGRLARLSGVRVASRAAIAPYSSPRASLRQLANDLGVQHVVDGSVRLVGDRVRVNVHLVDVATEQSVWSEQYDRELADVFVVQTDIALRIAQALQATLTPGERALMQQHPTDNLVAYDHFLRGNHELGLRTPASVLRAIQEYRAATALDSSFTQALVRQAYAGALFADWGWEYPGRSHSALLEEGLAITDRLLRDDSLSAEAWLTRAYLLSVRDPRHLQGGLDAFRRSLALDPRNAEAHHQYGQALMILGHEEEAWAAYRNALALEPNRGMTLVPLFAIHHRRREFDQARRWIDSAVTVSPTAPYVYAIRASERLFHGDIGGARQDAELALQIDPSYEIPARSMLALAKWRAGERVAARDELDRALAAVGDPAQPSPTDAQFLGIALVGMGEEDRFLDLLERVRPRGAWLWFYLQAPEFDGLRGDPRFQRVEADSRGIADELKRRVTPRDG